MALPTPLVSPFGTEVQALWDALTALMGDTYVTATGSASKASGSITFSASVADQTQSPNRNSWSVTQTIAGPVVTLAPVNPSLGPGETQQFSATVTDPAGVVIPGTITWKAFTGTVDATGLYTAPAVIAAASFDSVTATDVSGSSATVSVSLHT